LSKTVIGCATRMLESENPPDAFFCFNDRVATKVYRAITRKGLRVSGDIGLMGYDNSDLCEICDVKLTTVDYRNLEIGRKAAELLYGMNLGEHTPAFTIHTFMPRIVERESCLGKRAPYEQGGSHECETAGDLGA
jgi:DNA-binding LacI/PurR family transcriptional regulator